MKRNKNTTGIWHSTLRIALLLLTLSLASCADESLLPDRADKDQNSFTLELVPPGAFSMPQTRAALTNDEQNAINSAHVLIYNKTGYLEAYMAIDRVIDYKVDITLKSSKDENERFDIVVIANPLSKFSSQYQGKSKTELQEALIGDRAIAGAFVMWGEVTNVLIHSVSNTFRINMLRTLARVDIGVGKYTEATNTWQGLADFSLSSVTVVNVNDRFLVIPNAVKENGQVAGLSIPTNALKKDATYAVGNGSFIESEIFVPETESKVNNPVKLIIEGNYNGSLSFYRVDMCLPSSNGSYVDTDILRNHLYRITITKVSGAGYSTLDEAKKSPALNNMTVKLTTIAGWSGDIIFDGQSSLATDVSEVQIYGTPGNRVLFTVTANFQTGTTAKVTGPNMNEVPLRSGATQQIKATGVTIPGDYLYHIEVGRLKKEIKFRLQPAVDAHFDVLPFQNVASMTIVNPQSWITLSPNMFWRKSEQQVVRIEGNGSNGAYAHFDENLEQRNSKPRTAEVLIRRNTDQTLTRVYFDQSNITGMICANFGGNFKVTRNGNDISFEYEKSLAIESLEEFAFRIYDGAPYSAPEVPSENASLPFSKITAPIVGIRMGRFPGDFAGLGSGRDDEGSSTTFAHANASETGVSQFGLTIYNNYPSRYCYDKNRDEDGNGTIDANEVKWYVPTRTQLASLYLLRSTLATEFMTAAYWSIYVEAAGIPGNKRLGVMDLSTGVIGVDSRFRPIRCVRDISK